ncbi:S8 family serine peptidase [Neobacillus niacini]|uniref:S8 family serine peptidase n=1 Tax=Neobacillus niacini TaxID=86668 RepID=UPI002865E76D|nr:S8 family serine peptidase [Neobacillus niacini]MDR6998853.1 subtilisin family serine protease [Neobacillus niacini]
MRYLWSLGVMLLCMSWMGTAAFADELITNTNLPKTNMETNAFNDQELIVKFSSNLSKTERNSILKQVNGTEEAHLGDGAFSFIKFPKGTDLTKAAQSLLAQKKIVWAEPNYKVKSTYIPQEPDYSKQWYLNKIQMPKAWDVTKGSSRITVAVIDDGVQQDHPDLKGKIVSPYNAVTGNARYTPQEHATHVAGIIAASFNKTGIAGIAPDVKIMPINVFDGEEASDYAVALGIKYAVEHHADVINMSLGSPNYSVLLDYYAKYAKSKGVILIAAAGNDGTFTKTYPAALDSVVGVGATTSHDHVAFYSNKGSFVDFTAPGSNIYSTIDGSSYAQLTGTSMASPVVSGVAALVRSKNPFLTPDQVESIMKHSVVDLGTKGRDDYYGYGRIDAYKAVSNTPSPKANITAPKTFTMTGKNKAALALKLPGHAKVTLIIQNADGQTVKEVLKKTVSGTKQSVVWDGKASNGKFVPTGTYKAVVKASNRRASLSKTAMIQVVNHTYAAILVKGDYTFSPKTGKTVKIPYELTQKAKVTAVVQDKTGRGVKNIMIGKTLSTGKHSIIWDGKNSKGHSMKDSTYRLVMSLKDTHNKKGKTKKVFIKIDTIRPSGNFTLSSTVFKMDTKNQAKAALEGTETAKVHVFVIDEKGNIVKQLFYKQAKTATFSWNGMNAKKQFVPEGRYRYLVQLKDPAGNLSTIKSNFFTLQDWRVPTIQAEKDVSLTLQDMKPIAYTVSKAGKVTIDVTQGETFIKSIKNFGDQSFQWDGTNSTNALVSSGDYQYKITLVDKYGLSQVFTGIIHIKE